MSLNNFIPTLWSGEILKNLRDLHVYAQCCNRDYQSQLKRYGDSVKINSVGPVTIGTYTKYGDIGTPEQLDDSQMILQLTEQRYFNFAIDDIDEAQQTPQVRGEAMQEASHGLAEAADVFIASMLDINVAAANTLNGGSAIDVGTGAGDADLYELLVDLDVQLNTQNVPRNNRWVVLPFWAEGLFRKDPRWASFGTSTTRRTLNGEMVKNVAGFDIMVSNNVPVANSDEYSVIAGYSGAVTFAETMNKVEAYRPQTNPGFSDAIKGLHVYGGKVTRPYALAKAVISPAA